VTIKAAFPGRFLLFRDQRVGLRVAVLAYCGNLPGDFDVGGVGRDLELPVRDLLRYPGVGVAADGGELIAEVAVLRLKPMRAELTVATPSSSVVTLPE
jgi:hypothetical protein